MRPTITTGRRDKYDGMQRSAVEAFSTTTKTAEKEHDVDFAIETEFLN